jgi:hypothetical protein
MKHKGVEFTLAPSSMPGVWHWRFQIGDQIRTGKVTAKLELLAIKRVQLRIDRALKDGGL